MIEATSKDYVAITGDTDEAFIMRGRLWLIYHEIGSAVVDATGESETDADMLAADIRSNSDKIADAILKAREIR